MSDQYQQIDGTESRRAEAARWLRQNQLQSDTSALGRTISKGWIWSTTRAGAIGIAIGWLVFMIFDRMTGDHIVIPIWNRFIDLTTLAGNMAAGLTVGALVGLTQARRLKRYIAALADGWWVLSTAIAGILSGIVVWLPTSAFALDLNSILNFAPFSGAIIAHAIMGLLFGIAQWSVLRPHLPGSGRWIPACAVGAMAGAFLILLVLVSPLSYVITASSFCLNIPFNMLIGASGFLPASVATGYVLVRSFYDSSPGTSLLPERI